MFPPLRFIDELEAPDAGPPSPGERPVLESVPGNVPDASAAAVPLVSPSRQYPVGTPAITPRRYDGPKLTLVPAPRGTRRDQRACAGVEGDRGLVGARQHVEARRSCRVCGGRSRAVGAVDDRAEVAGRGVWSFALTRRVTRDLGCTQDRRVDPQSRDGSPEDRVGATGVVAEVHVAHRREAGSYRIPRRRRSVEEELDAGRGPRGGDLRPTRRHCPLA